jgi:hypothetical protein
VVLRGILISWTDIHHARPTSTQEEMKAKMDTHQKKMGAAIYSTWSELKETIKHRVEDVVLCRPKDAAPPKGTDRDD